MTTQRKSAPDVDRGGRVFYVEDGKVYEGMPSTPKCAGCHFAVEGGFCDPIIGEKRRMACVWGLNGDLVHRTLHPVRAVG